MYLELHCTCSKYIVDQKADIMIMTELVAWRTIILRSFLNAAVMK